MSPNIHMINELKSAATTETQQFLHDHSVYQLCIQVGIYLSKQFYFILCFLRLSPFSSSHIASPWHFLPKTITAAGVKARG